MDLTPEERRKYNEFFNPVIAELKANGCWGKAGQNYGYDRGFRTEFDGLEYRIGFWRNRKRQLHAYLWLHSPDRARDLRIHRQLLTYRSEIDREIGFDESTMISGWESSGLPCAGVGIPASITDPRTQLERAAKWLVEYLPRVKAAIDPRLEVIMRDLDD